MSHRLRMVAGGCGWAKGELRWVYIMAIAVNSCFEFSWRGWLTEGSRHSHALNIGPTDQLGPWMLTSRIAMRCAMLAVDLRQLQIADIPWHPDFMNQIEPNHQHSWNLMKLSWSIKHLRILFDLQHWVACEVPRPHSSSELVVPVKRTFIHYESCRILSPSPRTSEAFKKTGRSRGALRHSCLMNVVLNMQLFHIVHLIPFVCIWQDAKGVHFAPVGSTR